MGTMQCDDMPAKTAYRFTPTQDWFSFNIETWSKLFALVTTASPRVLEIGSWEGRSAVFLLDELCKDGGSIVCIDHFDLHDTSAGRERYATILHNLSLTGKPFRVMDEFSFPALMRLLEEEMSAKEPGFDWVYVDGSHEADDTLLDGELAWRLAKKGAIFIFDDYKWNVQPVDGIHHPKRGIDAFLSLHKDEYEVLSSADQYQVVLRKLSDMRIGFLAKGHARGQDCPQLNDALGSGVNVALTVDAAYAMPAAVCMRAVVDHTPGRLTFYVVDCGLADDDKRKIEASVSSAENTNVTVLFISLPDKALAATAEPQMNAVWAKLDMLRVLPVERVLYLDADVLPRADVRPLWEIDLQGKTLGACVDVGHPNGHADIEKGPYFNAGVLMVDLARARRSVDALPRLADLLKNAKFRDQDVLNAHFKADWLPLDLRWNAQGLGTYAEHPSEDRRSLDIASMTQQPQIVHFTGPINPTLVDVLNPWVQPCTSKPWGFVGAPGHPFAPEWWKVLDKTAWAGYATSEEHKERREKAMNNALEVAGAAFIKKVISLQSNMFDY
jgi:lipopolysaccharide biosynthesis glycosyltransferase/predicted O-methyltransferase YrrM